MKQVCFGTCCHSLIQLIVHIIDSDSGIICRYVINISDDTFDENNRLISEHAIESINTARSLQAINDLHILLVQVGEVLCRSKGGRHAGILACNSIRPLVLVAVIGEIV